MADEKQPMPIKDMFPDVNPERVRTLLEDKNFKASAALAKLNMDVSKRKGGKEDVTWLESIIDQSYTPAMEALNKQIYQSGYSQAELSGAFMVSQGMIRLPS